MSETDKSYWLLSETSGIGETRDPRLDRGCRCWKGSAGSSAGWRDPGRAGFELAYGVGVFLLSVAFHVDARRVRARLHPVPLACRIHDRGSFPGDRPYEKSRSIEQGRHIGFGSMLLVRPRAGAQIFFLGLLLCMLMLLWMRAAVLLYASSSGCRRSPGSTALSACSSARHMDGRCSWSERRSEACSRRSPSRSAYSRCR